MTKTQKRLMSDALNSSCMYRDLKTGTSRSYISVYHAREIKQAIELAKMFPQLFEVRVHGWKCVDLIATVCKTN